jgi:VCBS repeat protein/ASPM-SPD-2-Hydin domain-containing protein/HYDIN/CFA65/VesB family protein
MKTCDKFAVIFAIAIVLFAPTAAQAQVVFNVASTVATVFVQQTSATVGEVALAAGTNGTITAGSAIFVTYSAPILPASGSVACSASGCAVGTNIMFGVSGNTLTVSFATDVALAVGDSITIFNVEINPSLLTVGSTVTATAGASSTGAPITFSITNQVTVALVESNPPVVSLSATSLDFGSEVVGSTSFAKSITLSNTGGTALLITSVLASGDFSISNDTCGSLVSPAASCMISVTFTPTATGTDNGLLTITDNAADSPQAIPLTGTGVAAVPPVAFQMSSTIPTISTQDTSAILGTVMLTATTAGTITSGSAITLNYNAALLAGFGSVACSPVGCVAPSSFTVTLAGDSLTIVFAAGVSFAVGDSITVSGVRVNASGFGVGTVTATALGSAQITFNPTQVQVGDVQSSGGAAAALSPASLDFGGLLVGSASAAQVVVLTNSGQATLTVTGIVVSGDFAETDDCGTPLAPGLQCAILVIFTPTSPGSRTGSLTVNSNAQSSPPPVALTGTGTSQPTGTAPTFGSGAEYPTAAGPRSIITADFNGDSNLDIAVADMQSDLVSILLGNGDGTFQPKKDHGTGTSPVSIASGDFNRDGKLDVAVADSGQNAVTVLLGNGDGTFSARQDYPVGNGPGAVVIGDFNVDGILDLAVTNSKDNTISVLLGNGDGTFRPATAGTSTLARLFRKRNLAPTANGPEPLGDLTTGLVPTGVVSADFNGDRKPDLATANLNSNTVSIKLGNGDGTFGPPVSFGTGVGPIWVASGDFNADGKLDLAVANSTDGTVSILLGKGDGTFATHVDYPTGHNPVSVIVADLNKDGKLDLAVTNKDDGTIVVLIGNGDGTFAPAGSPLSGSDPTSVASGDFTPGGNSGVVVANAGSGSVTVFPITATTAPVVSLKPPTLSFNSQAVGTTSSPQDVTLSNTGNASLSIASIMPEGDYSVSNNACASSVNAGSSCKISVTFTPTETGTRSGTLTITDNAPNSPQTISLTGTGTDFSLSSSPSTATITAGQSQNFMLSVTSAGGFNQAVNLSCSISPVVSQGPACAVSPTSVTPSGSSAVTATVKVTTTARGRAAPNNNRRLPPLPGLPPLAWWVLGAWLMLGLASARKLSIVPRLKPGTFAVLAGGLLLVALWAACGGGGASSSPPPPSGTPAGNYTITITGASGSLSHTATVTLTVN